MDLEVRLEVQVRDRVLVRDLQQAGQNAVGDDAALVRRVKARVGLDVVGDELRDFRLRALGASGQLHEGAQLRRERAGLQEGVLGAAQLPRGLLLGRHVGDVLLHALALASLLDLLGSRLRRDQRVGDHGLELIGQARTDLAQALNHRRDGRGLASSGRHLRRGGRGRGGNRDNDLGLRRRLARGSRLLLNGGGSGSHGGRGGGGSSGLLRSGLLGGNLGISTHVCSRGRRLCGHF